MEIEKVKVPVDVLEVGMYVSELDRPWVETPFIFQGFLITNESELDQIHQYCEFVYIDRAKSQVKIPDVRMQKIEQAQEEHAQENHGKGAVGLPDAGQLMK